MNRTYIPSLSSFRDKNYITYRRLWLDSMLSAFAHQMRGLVVDLGGKRNNKRGTFSPPEQQAQAWFYINLDMDTSPNIYGNVTKVPMPCQSVDCVICTEVLEHLPDPQACVDEIHRLLRDDGLVFASTPFFYPVHADPYDFHRFTEDGLRHLFREFKSVDVYRMGGYLGVLGLLVELGIMGLEEDSFSHKLLRWLMKWISRWLIRTDLATFETENLLWRKFTTGYFVIAVR
ncbi:MAG: hypothetical protein OHK003_05640 [Anaerolineales bacterium]